MTAWTVFIPRWKPCSVNQLLSLHWAASSRKKAEDFKMVWGNTRQIPPATGKREVFTKIYITGKGRTPDPDNLAKSLNDALVKAKLLKDDSQTWARIHPIEFERGYRHGTEITLRDL
jgi:Holliday junction resolvase RusA-like endonuclease